MGSASHCLRSPFFFSFCSREADRHTTECRFALRCAQRSMERPALFVGDAEEGESTLEESQASWDQILFARPDIMPRMSRPSESRFEMGDEISSLRWSGWSRCATVCQCIDSIFNFALSSVALQERDEQL